MQDEVELICDSSRSSVLKDGHEIVAFDDSDNQKLMAEISDDLAKMFTLVPSNCVKETVNCFYPNMGKIEYVLNEFEKHWVNYNKDFDGYKKGKKDRQKKESKPKKERRFKNDDIPVNVDLLLAFDDLKAVLDSDISKDERRDIKAQLKEVKAQIKAAQKEYKRQQKDERKALRSEAKELKRAERAARKEENDEKRLEETKARSQKDYEDDVFFREVRKEPSILKQHLKEAKKSLKKATKEANESDIERLIQQIADLEKSMKEKEDEAIMQTYERYNRPEEYNTRLDLHGLRKKEAERLVEKIIKIRRAQISEKHGDISTRDAIEFNIVTGRGGHNQGRSVLKPAVKAFLIDNGIEYREFHNGAGYTALL